MAMRVLENELLKVMIADSGAELSSVYDKEKQTERLWDANPEVWNRHAPILFPFVGKVIGGVYRINGQEYEMKTQHGFARDMEFECVEAAETSVTHRLLPTEKTKQLYPFEYELLVTHKLDAENPRLLHVNWEVKNNGSDVMYYSIGGHPAFTVPVKESKERENYYLEFPDAPIRRVEFTPACFITGKEDPFEIEKHRYPLHHTMFNDDAIVLKGVAGWTRLASSKGSRAVTLIAPDLPVYGFWHMPKTDAPYVCIEPWSSLPSRQDVVEEFSCKSDMIQLAPRNTYENQWSITVF